ncbi:hypothetical protein [Oceanithermus sp.]|uniref:hypothetical protein n=1 Tax=Oceanithermus sp. TaxID=2268145 RepID=UPI0025EE6796|nr:hypothetical protein [Oceanithermus sp.]
MVWEESPEEFWERFREHAVRVELLPQPWSRATLEAVTPAGVLYPFDRGAPPAPVGRVELLLHAVAASFRYRAEPPGLEPLGAGRCRIRGRTLRDLGQGYYLLDAGVPLVLASSDPLEVGLPVEVRTEPPLMAFRNEGGGD